MGLYARYIFPRLVDKSLSGPSCDHARRDLLAGVEGDVLEIGFGTGLNLPHYSNGVRSVTAVDVNPGMFAHAGNRIAAAPFPVDVREGSGEAIPVPDVSCDCVVSAWTLCSVADIDRVLMEIHRVLKPGGRFVFLEHGLSDDPRVQRWQRWLTPVQKRIGGGCRLNRNFAAIVGAHPFQTLDIRNYYIDGAPRFGGYMYHVTAVK